jgi:hypothetical protein
MLRYPSRACGTINNSGVESWSDLRIPMSRGRTLRAPALDRRPQAPSTLTSASPDGRRTRLDPRKLGKTTTAKSPGSCRCPPSSSSSTASGSARAIQMCCFPSNNARVSTNRRKTVSCSVQAAAEAGSWRKTMRRLSGKATEAYVRPSRSLNSTSKTPGAKTSTMVPTCPR